MYDLVTKASKKLDDEVKQELKVPDVNIEKARAILASGEQNDTRRTKDSDESGEETSTEI